MLSSLRHFEPDPVRFETQAAQLRNEYEDGVKGRGGASQLAAQHADRLLYRIAYLPAELQALTLTLTLTHPNPDPNPNPNPKPNPNATPDDQQATAAAAGFVAGETPSNEQLASYLHLLLERMEEAAKFVGGEEGALLHLPDAVRAVAIEPQP